MIARFPKSKLEATLLRTEAPASCRTRHTPRPPATPSLVPSSLKSQRRGAPFAGTFLVSGGGRSCRCRGWGPSSPPLGPSSLDLVTCRSDTQPRHESGHFHGLDGLSPHSSPWSPGGPCAGPQGTPEGGAAPRSAARACRGPLSHLRTFTPPWTRPFARY